MWFLISGNVMKLSKFANLHVLKGLRSMDALQVAWRGWVVLSGVAIVILFLAIPGFCTRRPMGNLGAHLSFDPTPLMLLVHRFNLVGSFLAVLISFGLGALLFIKRKSDGMALFVAYYLVLHGLLNGGVVEMLEPLWPNAAAFNTYLLLPAIAFPMNVTLLAIFPDGRFVPQWTRLLIPFSFLLVLLTAAEVLSGGYDPTQSQMYPHILVIYAGLAMILLMMVGAQVYRYRHVSSDSQRQQTKWVLYGFLIMIALFAIGTWPWQYTRRLPPGSLMPWWLPLIESSWILGVLAVPIALTISVIGYRLYRVDILINRTLVYGAMSGFVVCCYILIVGGLSLVFQSNGNFVFSLLATGLVAVLFNPLRQRLQRRVNQLLYGERDEPLSVLRHLEQRLQSSGAPEETLNGIAETVCKALKLPYAEITLRGKEVSELLITYGTRRDALESFPILFQGTHIGSLNVASRGSGEALGVADHKLLLQIASQAGPIAHTVRLTRDLRQSRAHVVAAREEERRRLHRDLHDGLGPVLASQGLKIAAVSHLLDNDPERAREILDGLASQNEAAVAEIRRLVYALRPPELNELGLVEAIREYVAGLNVGEQPSTQFHLEASQLGQATVKLPGAVEVSAYRILTEALTNVARHAQADQCTVMLRLEETKEGGRLYLEIVDDGIGIPDDIAYGVGVPSMKQRAEEIGGVFRLQSSPNGRTSVVAELPIAR